MKAPQCFETLVRNGLVDEVVSRLMSGKEADVYVVQSKGKLCCAKVYKEARTRSFSQLAQYQEGRKGRNSRQTRAMQKNTKYGRKETEAAWKNSEVDALRTLADAGVRVPQVYDYVDGVLLMEFVVDAEGCAAPRLNDLRLSEAKAREYYLELIQSIVLMLCAGIIHGDLSEYNVLVGSDGLVIIDLPQAVNASGNNNARIMLERDVENITAYFGRFAPELITTDYGKEIWKLYASGKLSTTSELTGSFEQSTTPADVNGVMREIDYARILYQRTLARKSLQS
ncbi:MAG: serine protein kinase RIO [Desulfuromonadaceae bacterium]|nr:serine protein kinase RIO [Desulfuromonadaceae bacterium]MDD2847089.1 serine protein kinase RIO [Desulfuromonadaceae bacterium]MDD4128933.1 serine protein kinase RIO [Desulfuromonadaceae bacterium]